MDTKSHRYDKLESMLQNGSSKPRNFSLQYLRNITNNFSDERLLGEGGFGTVYMGVLPNGETIAVKKLNSSMPGVKDRHFDNEASSLMRLKHPNVLLLVGWCCETENMYVEYNGKYICAEKSERLLCLEYMHNGSLREFISDEASGLGWDIRYKIIEGICYGLHYLHEERQDNAPIVHMDLKPANILLDYNMVPKIGDFGLSRLFSKTKTWTSTINRDGTLGYMAPEYINRGLISTKSDIFSLGVIIIEIVTGYRDYPDDTGISSHSSQEFIELVLKNWRNRMQSQCYTSVETYCQQIRRCTQIGLVCVNQDRSKRPTTRQIIEMLQANGDHVHDMRKLFVLELLSMRRVQAAWNAREAQVDKLIENLTRAGRHPVSLDEHIFNAVDGIIGTVVFGEIYGTEHFKMQFVGMLNEAMDTLGSFSAEDFFPNAAGRFVDRLTGLVDRRDRIFRRLDAFFDGVIDQHLNPTSNKLGEGSNRSDLVQALLELCKDNAFTHDHVKAMLFDTFVGGINTSCVTMVWAMSELIQHPRTLKSVQDEIRAVVGNKERVSPSDVPKLQHLKMVVKEALRMHPPLTLLLPRETTHQVNIRGYDVPANTRIIINAWAISRDPNIWKDPEEFNPERFMASDIDFNGAHFEFMPFGSGRRICPGMAMAVTNMEFTLANLLCCFDWDLPQGVTKEDISMHEAGSLVFHKKTPLMLVPRRYRTSY